MTGAAAQTPPTKLLLVNHCSPGDVLMLTAAVRDLHRAYPRQYLTAVDTYCPDLWRNNPHLSGFGADEPDVRRVQCGHPPLLDRCNGSPRHYVESVHHLLADVIGREVPLTRFAPDVHLDEEEAAPAPDDELREVPYWVLVAGGKLDLTTKWWPASWYQQVVDRLAGRVRFVQAGAAGDRHPKLSGVVDRVGRTSLRDLVRLVYHAQGVVCPVTCAMHLAAAFDKPAVVIAGGREPPHWEMYPGHQFLHAVGLLPCCADRGCWKARVVPLGDGDRDRDGNTCERPVWPEQHNGTKGDPVAACMALTEPQDVVRAVERCVKGIGDWKLEIGDRKFAISNFQSPISNSDPKGPALTESTARGRMEEAARAISPYPGGFDGRGVVIPAGGATYFPCAWVCIRMLRQLGCSLPVELWHLGSGEVTDAMRRLLAPMDVRCVDACEVRTRHPARILNGWELKPYAILHSRFREVLMLDADNVPVIDPTYLFETDPYRRCGAVLWPDLGRLGPEWGVWRLTGVPYRDEPDVESGQVLVDKRACWAPLQLTMWMNEHSDFWYRHVYGDKETFRFAWHKLGAPFAMPSRGIELLPGVFCQHDFDGRRVFQHRNRAKWTLRGPQAEVPGFLFEQDCRRHLEALREQWDG